jgi:hypothetical protein
MGGILRVEIVVLSASTAIVSSGVVTSRTSIPAV